jgi:CheY-like chemotaxis protein
MIATSHIEKTDDRLSHTTSLSAQHASLESFGHNGRHSSSLNPDRTKVHYSAEPKGLMFEMLAMSDIEMGAIAQRRTTPGEKPASEIVCLVDDDPMVLRSTGSLLASDGFAVCPFDKGEDFIAYVASHDVPVVVLDIWMKGMNGLEVLARLCAISPQTHVIVITGHEDAAARIMAKQIGTVAFFIKPFDDEEFLEAVHRALGHAPESSSRKPSLSVSDLVGVS